VDVVAHKSAIIKDESYRANTNKGYTIMKLVTIGGIGSKVNTHKLILTMQKNWTFVEHKG
jgi:hypothetical protein